MNVVYHQKRRRQNEICRSQNRPSACVGEGFDCMSAGEKRTVQYYNGWFYVICEFGNHYLDGQLNADGSLTGFQLDAEKIS